MFEIRSKIKNEILNYFFLNEGKSIYINELARIIKADPKNVYRALIGLEDMGVLASNFKGNERYFSCNKSNPLYKSYKDIFLKTKGLESIIKKELREIGGIKQAYIYGSYAKNKFGPKSDIDILIIGEHDRFETQRALYKIQRKAGREINAVNMKTEEFKKKKTEKNTFVKTIFQGKTIKLI